MIWGFAFLQSFVALFLVNNKTGHLMPFLVLKFSLLAQSYKQTYVLNFKIALNYKIDKGLWKKSLNWTRFCI